MKKIIAKLYALTFALCFAATLMQSASALPTAAETKATIEFTEGEGPTLPVDPEDPGDENETEPPVTGSLAIVTVSSFDFGVIPVQTTMGMHNNLTSRPNIQVVDLRGTSTGWSVSAQLSRFILNDGDLPADFSQDPETIRGAVIHFRQGHPNSLSQSPAPTQQNNLKIFADGAPVKLISALDGAGTGLWVMRWYTPEQFNQDFVQLEVPAGAAMVGSHIANIDWTLYNTP